MNTHFFLALSLKNDLKEELVHYRNLLKGISTFKKWVHEQDYHITLAFLGNVDKQTLAAINNKVEKLTKRHVPFILETSGPGYFGKAERPRIFWYGVKESKPLKELQWDIASACRGEGVSIEKRMYRPHITLAKNWNGEEHFSSELLEQLPTMEYAWNVESVVLFQTHLKQVPMYEAKRIFPLNKGANEYEGS